MYVGYYVSDRFPYPQGPAGPFPAYAGFPRLDRRYTSIGDVRALGFYRTNENIQRNYVRGRQLGDLTLNTPLLLGGMAALAAAFFLLGGKTVPKMRARRAGRLRKRHARLGEEIRRLEA